jgi:hypothetical protein
MEVIERLRAPERCRKLRKLNEPLDGLDGKHAPSGMSDGDRSKCGALGNVALDARSVFRERPIEVSFFGHQDVRRSARAT